MTTISKQLADILDRHNILSGRQLALLHRDELLRLIQSGDSPGEKLVSELGLTQKQAVDILSLNLYYFKRLAALDVERELKEVNIKISELIRASGASDSQYATGKPTVTETLSKEDFWRNNTP